MGGEEERSCLRLKGDYVDAGKFKSFEKKQKGLTVMCWFQTYDYTNWMHLVNQGGGWDDKGWSLFKFGNQLRIELQNDTKVILDNDPSFDTEKFNHACFTYDGSTIKAYVNGKLLDKEASFTGDLNPSLSLNFGRNEKHSCILDGRICEVKIFKKALKKKDIKKHMYTYDKEVLDVADADGLIGYWPLNNTLKNLVTDEDATSKAKFVTYSLDDDYKIKKYNQKIKDYVEGEEKIYCLSLSNNQFVDCGNFKSFEKGQKGLTVMCWFKSSNLEAWQHLVNQGSILIKFRRRME
jgi:hypothetical protein